MQGGETGTRTVCRRNRPCLGRDQDECGATDGCSWGPLHGKPGYAERCYPQKHIRVIKRQPRESVSLLMRNIVDTKGLLNMLERGEQAECLAQTLPPGALSVEWVQSLGDDDAGALCRALATDPFAPAEDGGQGIYAQRSFPERTPRFSDLSALHPTVEITRDIVVAYQRMLEAFGAPHRTGVSKVVIHPALAQIVFTRGVAPPWLVEANVRTVYMLPYDTVFPTNDWILLALVPTVPRIVVYDARGRNWTGVDALAGFLPVQALRQWTGSDWKVQPGACHHMQPWERDSGMWMLHNTECLLFSNANDDAVWYDAAMEPPDLRTLSNTTPAHMNARRERLQFVLEHFHRDPDLDLGGFVRRVARLPLLSTRPGVTRPRRHAPVGKAVHDDPVPNIDDPFQTDPSTLVNEYLAMFTPAEAQRLRSVLQTAPLLVDLQGLLSGGLVDPILVAAYAEHVHHWIIGTDRWNRRCHLLHPALGAALAAADDGAALPHSLVHPGSLDWFLIPTPVAEGHWILVVVMPRRRSVVVYDSEPTPGGCPPHDSLRLVRRIRERNPPWSVDCGTCRKHEAGAFDGPLWMLHNAQLLLRLPFSDKPTDNVSDLIPMSPMDAPAMAAKRTELWCVIRQTRPPKGASARACLGGLTSMQDGRDVPEWLAMRESAGRQTFLLTDPFRDPMCPDAEP